MIAVTVLHVQRGNAVSPSLCLLVCQISNESVETQLLVLRKALLFLKC